MLYFHTFFEQIRASFYLNVSFFFLLEVCFAVKRNVKKIIMCFIARVCLTSLCTCQGECIHFLRKRMLLLRRKKTSFFLRRKNNCHSILTSSKQRTGEGKEELKDVLSTSRHTVFVLHDVHRVLHAESHRQRRGDRLRELCGHTAGTWDGVGEACGHSEGAARDCGVWRKNES